MAITKTLRQMHSEEAANLIKRLATVLKQAQDALAINPRILLFLFGNPYLCHVSCTFN